jgi:hypothetical protein
MCTVISLIYNNLLIYLFTFILLEKYGNIQKSYKLHPNSIQINVLKIFR